MNRLNAVSVPCGPINDIRQGFEDPAVQHLRMSLPAAHPELDDLGLIRSTINLSHFPHRPRFVYAAPDPGIDSAEILGEIGLDAERISALRDSGVIWVGYASALIVT